MKRRNPQAEDRRDSSEVMGELVLQLSSSWKRRVFRLLNQLGEERDSVSPNLDRLTVGVDLGDQWRRLLTLGSKAARPCARASLVRGGRKLASSFKAWRFLVWLSKWELIRRGYGK